MCISSLGPWMLGFYGHTFCAAHIICAVLLMSFRKQTMYFFWLPPQLTAQVLIPSNTFSFAFQNERFKVKRKTTAASIESHSMPGSVIL